jgi:hypothetical protein
MPLDFNFQALEQKVFRYLNYTLYFILITFYLKYMPNRTIFYELQETRLRSKQ